MAEKSFFKNEKKNITKTAYFKIKLQNKNIFSANEHLTIRDAGIIQLKGKLPIGLLGFGGFILSLSLILNSTINFIFLVPYFFRYFGQIFQVELLW